MAEHHGTHKQTICVDFDGVLHRYSKGWQGGEVYDEPVRGAQLAMRLLLEQGYEIVICTARESLGPVYDWLSRWSFPALYVTNVKPAAGIYIDDRALRFEGWLEALGEIYRLAEAGEMGA